MDQLHLLLKFLVALQRLATFFHPFQGSLWAVKEDKEVEAQMEEAEGVLVVQGKMQALQYLVWVEMEFTKLPGLECH